jgi:RNA recognition motif-containing protein
MTTDDTDAFFFITDAEYEISNSTQNDNAYNESIDSKDDNSFENKEEEIIKNEINSERVYMSGIGKFTSKCIIEFYFRKLAPIEYVFVMVDKKTKTNTGLGFVCFKNKEDENGFIGKKYQVGEDLIYLSRKRLHAKKENKVIVKRVEISNKNDDRLSIGVGGLGNTITGLDLIRYFDRFGDIQESKIINNSDGTTKGYGFIKFYRESAVQKSCQQMMHVIKGIIVNVEKVQNDKTKKNSSVSDLEGGVYREKRFVV